MPQMASVSVGWWVGVGGRFEPNELNGASHFIEHMLFKGTLRRTAHQISQAVEGIGGYLNAFTGEENTCFYAKARAEHFERLLEVLADMFFNSLFSPEDIQKEREVIKEELAMYMDQPQHLVHELLNETMWPDQPLGRPITGTEASLDRIGRNQLLAFRTDSYVAPALIIAVAGNVEVPRVMRAVQKISANIPAARRPSFQQARSDQRAPRVRIATKATSQLQLALGFRVCSRHDDRRFALRLLNTVLGENASSRLFQVLREDHGLTYCIHSSLSHYDDVGSLTVSAGLDNSDIDETLALIVRELRRLCEQLLDAKELKQARDFLIGQMDLGLESSENQMMWLGEHLLGYGKVIPPEEVKRRIYEVKASEIRKVARDFFKPERVTATLVSSLKKVPNVEKRLLTLQ